jgi:hypothetical protein
MFLVFQLLVVLTTNNGNCHITKKVMTIITLTILNTYATFPLSQTPTRLKMTCCIMGLWWQQDYGMQFFWNVNITNAQGSIYIGKGWTYMLEFNNFMYIVIFVIGFATLSFLMAHVTMCYYLNIANFIVKMVPLLIDLIISIKYVPLNQRFLTCNSIFFLLWRFYKWISLLMRSSNTISNTV